MDLGFDVEALVAAIAEADRGRPHGRKGFPKAVRKRATEYAVACRERGDTLLDIAARLGLRESTVSRWLRRRAKEGAPSPERPAAGRLLPVAVGARSTRTGSAGSCGGSLRLITPGGYVVEGLELADLARLLEVLQ